MNRFKKAFSVGMSAALLASLMATAAAPAALAALTSTSGGTVVPGGTSAAFSITFAEEDVADFSDGSFAVSVADADNVDGGATWVTSSVPTVVVNAGVGAATTGYVADTVVVTVTGTDSTKIDSFTIGNLKVKAALTANDGAVIFGATEGGDPVGLPQTLVTASGVTNGGFIGSGVSQAIAITSDAGSPPFAVTNAACSPSSIGKAGKVHVDASGVQVAEDVTITATDGTTSLTGVFLVSKPGDVAVTQTVCALRFPSAVTVGDAVKVSSGSESMQAGVNNQDGGDVTVALGYFDGLLQENDTVTFTLDTAGVLFSPTPCLTSALPCVFGSPDNSQTVAPQYIIAKSTTLSADRKSITVTLDEPAGDDAGTEGSLDSPGVADSLTFNPLYDLALGLASGTTVDVAVTVSRAGVTVKGSPATVGIVGFVVAGSTAAPKVLIGQNDQSTGMIRLVESAAGSMGDGDSTDNDLIEVCLEDDDDTDHWSVGRYFWAVVTSGDLKLNIGGLPVAQGKMTVNGNCLEINIYTESTVASTVEIRSGTSSAPDASDPLNGPKVNIDNDGVPGPVAVDVYVDGTLVGDNIVIGVRAYSGTPIVTVSTQTNVVRGGLAQAIGNITLTEGAPNQFNEDVSFDVCLYWPSLSFTGAYTWTTPVGINAPVVTTNSVSSGLLAYFVPSSSGPQCLSVDVVDTSLGGLATVTLSNLRIDVRTDAPLGPVFVRVTDSDSESGFLLDQTVSPAKVVELRDAGLTAGSALGVTKAGPFTTTTKVQSVGKYVSWRFSSSATAGKIVEIWVATRNADGSWGAFTKLTSRLADGVGNTFFHWRSSTAQWISVRAHYPGDSSTAHSWSPARQARWR